MGNEKSKPGGGGGGGVSSVLGKRGPSVKELVERAQRTGVLALPNSNLKDFPLQILELAGALRNLDLSKNRMVSLPGSIGGLKGLKQLHLDSNRLLSLPDELGELKKLETLTAAENQISRLPDSLVSCLALKKVALAQNNLAEFPKPLCHAPNLEMVDLTGNRLTALPEEVGECRALELILSRNQLSSLSPARLAKAPRLKVLRLEENCLPISEFTEELLGDSKIAVLAVDGNLFQDRQFRDLPGYEKFEEKSVASKRKMY